MAAGVHKNQSSTSNEFVIKLSGFMHLGDFRGATGFGGKGGGRPGAVVSEQVLTSLAAATLGLENPSKNECWRDRERRFGFPSARSLCNHEGGKSRRNQRDLSLRLTLSTWLGLCVVCSAMRVDSA